MSEGQGDRLFDSDDLKRRGLLYNGRFLPYNPDLVPRAKELRKHMTPAEWKLWAGFLRTFRHRMLPQRPIDNYIVDFYCPSLKLVIEIDGEQHYSEAGKTYDSERDGILAAYGITVLRFSNKDVMERFTAVCGEIGRKADPPIAPR